MSPNDPVFDAHAMVGEENHLALRVEDLLRRMDAAGIAYAAARPMGAELAVENRAGNDRVLSGGTRVRGWITANPWFGGKALDELKRCRDCGGVAGLFLHPARQGFLPTEPSVEPLVAFASEEGWPVMFHTGTYIFADVLAVVEVARCYPQTPFVAGFGGFTDMWFELPGAMAEASNLLLDASMMWGAAVEEVVQSVGAERVLFGGAEPRNRYASTLAMVGRLALDDGQRRAILYENARRVFRWPSA